jgi:hypothetical protein
MVFWWIEHCSVRILDDMTFLDASLGSWSHSSNGFVHIDIDVGLINDFPAVY